MPHFHGNPLNNNPQMTWPNISYLHRYADVGKGLPTKRGGVCNPAANVLCEITASDIPQNVSDGITNPVRLRKLSIKSALEGTPSPSLAFGFGWDVLY